MDLIEIVFCIAIPAVFAVGVIFHKYVVSDAQAVKLHVTAEIADVRADFADHVTDIRKDIAALLSKAASKL